MHPTTYRSPPEDPDPQNIKKDNFCAVTDGLVADLWSLQQLQIGGLGVYRHESPYAIGRAYPVRVPLAGGARENCCDDYGRLTALACPSLYQPCRAVKRLRQQSMSA